MNENGPLKIYLIEDSQSYSFYISTILQKDSYHVFCEEDGEKAYQYLLNPTVKPDIVIVDYNLPGMSGLEIIEQLNTKSIEYLYIILTTENSADIAVKALKAGATDYIVKKPDLKNELKIALEKNHLIFQERQENKKLLQQLVESENRFRAIFQNHSAIMLLIDPVNFKIIDANKAATEYYGYLKDELTNLRMDQINILPKEDIEYSMRSAEIDQQNIFTFKHKLANGEIRDVEVHSSPVSVNNQLLLYSIVQDITEKKKAEENLENYKNNLENLVYQRTIEVIEKSKLLKESEQLFKIFADYTYSWETYRDKNGKFLYISSAFEKITGYKKNDYINGEITLDNLIYPEDLEKTKLVLFETINGENIENHEFRIITNNGDTKYLSVSANQVYLETGERIGVRSSIKDITDKKIIERELKESEVKYRSIFENSIDGICVHKDGFICYLNPASLQMFGYEKVEDVIGKHIIDFVTSESALLISEYLKKRYAGENAPQNYHIVAVRSNGELFDIEANSSTYEINNEKFFINIIRDISDRKKMDKILIESEKKFRNIFDSSTEGMMITDFEGNLLEVNQESVLRLGISKEKLLKMNFKSFTFLPQEILNDYLNNIIESQNANIEGIYENLDGIKYFIEVNGKIIDYQGSNAILLISRDITRRKLAEHALKESEEKFRKLWDMNPVPVLINKIVDGEIVDANPAFLNLVQYKIDDIIGKKPTDIHLWDYDLRKTIRTIYEKKGRIDNLEVYLHPKTASMRTVILSLHRIKIDGEDCFVGTSFDITQLKNAENALKESETRFRTLIETSNDWIWRIDPNGKFTYSSPKVKEILGFPAEKILGKSILDFFHSDESLRLRNIFEQKFTNRDPLLNIENMNIHKNGNKVILETNGIPVFDVSGNFIGYQGINRDITERKKIEKKIIQTTIETEEKERSRFAKDLHDGLSPLLSTLKLYSSKLTTIGDSGQLHQLVEKTNQTIDEAISSITEISNNISPHILMNFGLEEAIKSSIRKIVAAKSIKIEFKCKLKQRFDLNIEATVMRVANELMHNTVKHAQASLIIINLEQIKNEISLNYRDNGKGFDYEEVLAQKHERMGLKNIYDRIHSLGGKINFITDKGQGVIVWIELTI